MKTHPPLIETSQKAGCQPRPRLIRLVMPMVKADEDAQASGNVIYQDDAAIAAYPDDDARWDMAQGIIRFCEHACGYTR